MCRGIIPAYAGSTTSTAPTPPWRRDHPRIRGEHPGVESRRRFLGGSSPHTRGARRAAQPKRQFHGIIPAYAGSTSPASAASSAVLDHPRIRGEHSRPGAPRPGGGRIIPAYAGSTAHRASDAALMADHPRIRGEHRRSRRPSRLAEGSSPHTRGAPRSTRRHPRRSGIIPAYAGSTP